MGKQASPRKVADNEALAVGTQIRGSAQKLNLVAALIRGRRPKTRCNILSFSHEGDGGRRPQGARHRRSPMPRTTTISTSTRSSSPRPRSASAISMKRFTPRARGRSSRIVKPFSRVRIVVREQQEA